MKTKIIIALFAICSGVKIQAQNTPVIPIKTYKTWISMKGIQNEWTGVLFETGDSSIMISNSLKKQDYLQGKYDVSKVDIRNIDVIKIRKKNRIGYGALIGGSAGLVIGGIVGYAITKADNSVIINDFNLSTEYVLYGVLLTSALTAGVGAIIGAAIGSHKTKIPVNGNQLEYDKYKSKLNRCSIKNNPIIGAGSSASFSKIGDILVDVDGNVYHTVALGGQDWMAE